MPSPALSMNDCLNKLRAGSVTELSDLYGTLVALPDNFGTPSRKRLFTPTRTFWLFLSQVFGPNCSCRANKELSVANPAPGGIRGDSTSP